MEILTLAVVIVALLLMLFSSRPPELIALTGAVVLMGSGAISLQEGLKGFSSEAVVTIASLFVISEGLFRTGVLNLVANLLTRLSEKGEGRLFLVLMLVAGASSMFLNNTAIVALLIPVVLRISSQINTSPSRMLMGLSFASMLGGICTLLGTSTNLIASSIWRGRKGEAFGVFEFTPVGVTLFLVGVLVLFIFNKKLIPSRRQSSELTEAFATSNYITDFRLTEEADSVGKTVSESPFTDELGMEILSIKRNKLRFGSRNDDVLHAGDELRVKGKLPDILDARQRHGIELAHDRILTDADFDADDFMLLEAVVSPHSSMAGRLIKNVDLFKYHAINVLAIRRLGETAFDRLQEFRLSGGDTLLLEVRKDQLKYLHNRSQFVFLSETTAPKFRRDRSLIAILIVAAVVAVSSFSILPIGISAAAGACVALLTGCLKIDEAYDSIDWGVLILIASFLGMGVAMEKSGLIADFASAVVPFLKGQSPFIMTMGFFGITIIITSFLSNNAAVAILVPLAYGAGLELGVNPKMLVISVTMAASMCFLTPIGYQTNLMIMGPGGFKFKDFLWMGTLMTLVMTLLASVLISIVWA